MIDIRANPIDQDSKLREISGFGLSLYASVLEGTLTENVWHDRSTVRKKNLNLKALKKIEQIKIDTMNSIRSFLNISPSLLLGYPAIEGREDILKTIFKLGPFYNVLNEFETMLKTRIYYAEERQKGRHITKKIKIASIWARAMKHSWPNVTRLLKWFYIRLENTTYGNEIRITDDIRIEKKKLKNQGNYILKEYKNDIDFNFKVCFKGLFRKKNIPPFDSIKFYKDRIEVCARYDYENSAIKLKTEFLGKKVIDSIELFKMKAPIKKPHIIFPNGEIFYDTSG